MQLWPRSRAVVDMYRPCPDCRNAMAFVSYRLGFFCRFCNVHVLEVGPYLIPETEAEHAAHAA